MILTGPKIEECVNNGDICIDPYRPDLVGPNSIDLCLANDLRIYTISKTKQCLSLKQENTTRQLTIPDGGLVLRPGTLYLARTIERVGSNKYVPIVEGRSSIGRLGIRIHQTAGFCDVGFHGTITLEMDVLHPVRVFSGVPICQAYFLEPIGPIRLYEGRYQNQIGTTPSKIHTDER